MTAKLRQHWTHEFSTLLLWIIAWSVGQSFRYFLGMPSNPLAWISVFALGGLFGIAWFSYVAPKRRRVTHRFDRMALLLMVGGLIAWLLTLTGVGMNEWLCAGCMWIGIGYLSVGKGEERKPVLDKSDDLC